MLNQIIAAVNRCICHSIFCTGRCSGMILHLLSGFTCISNQDGVAIVLCLLHTHRQPIKLSFFFCVFFCVHPSFLKSWHLLSQLRFDSWWLLNIIITMSQSLRFSHFLIWWIQKMRMNRKLFFWTSWEMATPWFSGVKVSVVKREVFL